MLLNCGAGDDSWIPWTAKRSNQSFLKKINPKCSLEGLMLKLKFWYFDHLIWRADPLEKILMLGKIKDKKKRGPQRIRWLQSIMDSNDMNLSKLLEIVKDREAWLAEIHGTTKSYTQLSDWTTTIMIFGAQLPMAKIHRK